MSYDLMLFADRPGIDPRGIAQAVGEPAPGPSDPKIEAKKREVANLLIAHDPRPKVFAPDFDEIAKLHKITPQEAQSRFRHLELNDEAQQTSGIQLTLFDDGASLTIPYWHKGGDARRVLAQAWDLIGIVCRECGYEVFDPQLDRVIDVNAFDEVFARYQSMTARMAEMIGRAPPKPWWKFW